MVDGEGFLQVLRPFIIERHWWLVLANDRQGVLDGRYRYYKCGATIRNDLQTVWK